MAERSIEVHEQEDGWTALYVNGKMDNYYKDSNSYLVDERIRELLGVATVHDDAFTRGSDDPADFAVTLEGVEFYKTERAKRLEKAAAIREQADELRRQADELESASYDGKGK